MHLNLCSGDMAGTAWDRTPTEARSVHRPAFGWCESSLSLLTFSMDEGSEVEGKEHLGFGVTHTWV